jgi:fatty-acyl-CoA synthase
LLSFVSGTGPDPLLYETVDDVLKRAAATGANRTAVVAPQQMARYTFGEFDEAVERVARGFVASGLKVGERVGIWAPNCIEWVLTMFAAARAGLILVNINPAYRGYELEHALRLVECSALVFAPAYKGSDHLPMLEELIPELPDAAPGTMRSALLPELRLLVRIGDTAAPGCVSFKDLEAEGRRLGAAALATVREHCHPDQPANIQFTSGTTGSPKRATLTHFNIVNNGFFVGECMRLTAADRICIPVPLYHCFGMVLGVLAAMTHGAASVFPCEGFDPLITLQVSSESGARHCTAYRRCSLPSSSIHSSRTSISPRCAPASWRGRHARLQ